jgi:acyl transferase domain-containing protein
LIFLSIPIVLVSVILFLPILTHATENFDLEVADFAITQWPALSADGISRSFDASANGYTRAEAINAMYIKPLSAALRDEDPIRCVIRGVSVNFDGKTSSIALPSSQMQEAMMRKAYLEAGLNPKETPYVEVSNPD